MNNQHTLTDNYKKHSYQEEQLIYDHLLALVQVETPEQMLNRFRQLFIEGFGYPDQKIFTTVNKLVSSKDAKEDFTFILNRCCHILINRWHRQPDKEDAIPSLINLFEEARPRFQAAYGRARAGARLCDLVGNFMQSEEYILLKRLSEVIKPTLLGVQPIEPQKPLGSLISRYPYLYQHCLLTEESGYEQERMIKKLQKQRQQQFEIDLSHYVTRVARQHQMKRQAAQKGFSYSDSLITNIDTNQNPSLLSDRELFTALKQYAGKIDGNKTHKDFAQNFLAHTNEIQTFKGFKDNLYEYLISTVDSDYVQKQFADRLYKHLEKTVSSSDSQKFSEFLMVRTCSQMLNFLVVESPKRPQHFVFIDLISNLGPIATTSLLLRIVLLCSKVRPYLEQRLAILFNHYEGSESGAVKWLVKMLENVNLALSTNFGAVDLYFIR